MPNPSQLNNSKTQKHDDMHLWLRGDNVLNVVVQVFKDPITLRKDWCPFYQSYGVTEEHQRTHIRHKDTGWSLTLDDIKREVPVYSKNYNSKYLQGICDVIIYYYVKIDQEVEEWWMTKVYDEVAIQKELAEQTEQYERCIKDNKLVPIKDNKLVPTREHIIKYRRIKYEWKPEYLQKQYKATRKHEPEFNGINKPLDTNDKYRILVDFKPVLTSISGIIGQLKVYRDCIGPSDLMIITYDKNEKYDAILKDEGIHIMRIEEPED